MKKIFVLVGSRRKQGNTIKFVKSIIQELDKNKFEIEYAFPQDYNISHCVGCHSCFINNRCISDDDTEILQKKVLASDLLIIASPVYLHYFTADLKLFMDKASWWTHTLRLQGKPVVILSTCGSNGFNTVIKPLGEIMAYMGGNVIATANAAAYPNQINNLEWLKDVSSKIAQRIKKYIKMPPKSNIDIEKIFPITKACVMQQADVNGMDDVKFCEYEYWKKTGMIEYDSFGQYLKIKYDGGEYS